MRILVIGGGISGLCSALDLVVMGAKTGSVCEYRAGDKTLKVLVKIKSVLG